MWSAVLCSFNITANTRHSTIKPCEMSSLFVLSLNFSSVLCVIVKLCVSSNNDKQAYKRTSCISAHAHRFVVHPSLSSLYIVASSLFAAASSSLNRARGGTPNFVRARQPRTENLVCGVSIILNCVKTAHARFIFDAYNACSSTVPQRTAKT